MRSLMPWTGVGGLKQEMDRLLERFIEPQWSDFLAGGDWAPSLDVSETKEAFIVKVEIPGIDTSDINVSLQESLLTIRGEKKQEKMERDERYHRVERSHGAFTRAVRLPMPVDGDKVTAAFKNGLLTVTLPKMPEAKGSTIQVQSD